MPGTTRSSSRSTAWASARILQWETEGRKEVKELSGQSAVPVLETDGGEVVADSKRIIEWAEAHPAP